MPADSKIAAATASACNEAMDHIERQDWRLAASVFEGLALTMRARERAANPPAQLPQSLRHEEPEPVYFEQIGMCYYRRLGKRQPRRGEYYLSGAVVTAYRAPSDMSASYMVVTPVVRAERVRMGSYTRGAAVTIQQAKGG